MVNAKATEIYEININENPNCSKNDPDHLSENNTANSSEQSNEYGIKNLAKIFPFKRQKMPNYLKDSNNSRLDRWFIKSYNLKLSRSKLKSVIRTSALLSGFAMVAMVELDIDYESFFESFEESGPASSNKSIISEPTDAPISNTVLILYGLVTCLLIGVNMIAIIISTCILPQLNALSYEDLEIETFSENNSNQETKNEFHRNFSIKKIDTFDTTHFDLPYKKFNIYIETAWICSTVLGIFLFILDISIISYIKLNHVSKIAMYVAGAILFLTVLIFFVYTFIFFKYFSEFRIKTRHKIKSKLDTNELMI